MATKKIKNIEGDQIQEKQPHDTTAEQQADKRPRHRVLVAFNTDSVPDKAFPAQYQQLEPHNRVIYCRPSSSVAYKLRLDEAEATSYDEKTGKIRKVKGSKGAKSFKFLFSDNDNKNKLTSYSLPVPSWVNLAVFAESIGKALLANKALDDCKGIITPDGVTYSAKSLTKLLKLSDRDSKDNTQDGDTTPDNPDNSSYVPF